MTVHLGCSSGCAHGTLVALATIGTAWTIVGLAALATRWRA